MLVLTMLGACAGDDDEEPVATTTTTEAQLQGTGEATVTGTEYAFEIDGVLTAGRNAITFENRGEEVHSMVLARLKPDVTIDDVVARYREDTAEDRGGGDSTTTSGERTTTSRASRSQSGRTTTSTTSAEDSDGEEEEDAEDDPQFDVTTGVFDGLLSPGETQTITAELPDAGTYAVLCFIPTSDDESHANEGMVAELEVAAEGEEAEVPVVDHKVTVDDGDLDVDQQELEPGATTFEVQNVGDEAHAFTVYRTATRRDSIQSVDRFFAAVNQHEVPETDPPGAIVAHHFHLPPGETAFFTIDLAEGEYDLGCTFEQPAEEEDEEGDQHLDRRGEIVRVIVADPTTTSTTTGRTGGTTGTTTRPTTRATTATTARRSTTTTTHATTATTADDGTTPTTGDDGTTPTED